MENLVLPSTRILITNPEHVSINKKILLDVAKKFSTEELIIPLWDLPIYTDPENYEQTADFVFLENSINFAFTDFKTKQKFKSEYKGIEWAGSTGMVACLKKALENKKTPILNSEFLSDISLKQISEIFQGNMQIPMLEERHKIFREVGQVLSSKYQGHFYNLIEEANNELFGTKKGLIEKLTTNFPSFNDSIVSNNSTIRFDKRAQLAPAILYGKLQKTKFNFYGINELTVFADYVLPKGLRDLGILNYSQSLAKKIDNQELIEPNSKEELEIRAATIHASDMLIKEINNSRKEKINALHMDYKLWFESRKNKSTHHHLTTTIAY